MGATEERVKKLKLVIDQFNQAGLIFDAKATTEEVILIQKQALLRTKVPDLTVGLNLNESISLLIQRTCHAEADMLKKDFKISDKKFWWLKVEALGITRNWSELEKFAKSKKSPIGYRPFIEACISNGSRGEAAKYIERVTKEEQVIIITVDLYIIMSCSQPCSQTF